MKIFGWMHKKLHLGTPEYHRVAHRNSTDVILSEERGGKNVTLFTAHEMVRDTEAPLLYHVLLTIGTLGHSCDSPPQQQQEIQPEVVEEASADHDQEGQQHSTTAVVTKTSATAAAFHKPEPAVEQVQKNMKQEAITEEEITSQEPLLKEDKERIEKRTTLADLFAAEAANATSADKRQATCPTKNTVKKIKNGEESSPKPLSATATKKMHRLITRMLKKRIHPDLVRGDQERHGRRGATSDAGAEGNGDFH